MKKIGVGVVGIQGYGSTYFGYLCSQEDVEVRTVCDLNMEAAQKIAAKYGIEKVTGEYEDLLKDDEIQAVFLATPHFLHYDMTMRALRAGKHVFCEKPLAITAEQAWEMARTARLLHRKLTCHFNRRQTVPVKLFRDLIRQGKLGEIYQVNVKWMARYTGFMFSSNSSWRVSKEKAGGGILIGRGSHMLDAALYLLGNPGVQSVTANISSRLCGFDVDDYAMVVLKLDNGAVIHLECSYEANLPGYEEKLEYEILGTKGGARSTVTDGKSYLGAGYCTFPENRWVDLLEDTDVSVYEQAEPRSITEDFINSIRYDTEPCVTGEDGAFITELLQNAYLSAEKGQEILLDPAKRDHGIQG